MSATPARQPALELRGVVKRYARGEPLAVRGVDLTLGPGEVAALVGESGCGKTTILRLVAGLETPDEGEVRIGGRTVAGGGAWVAPERRGVGMVFQDFALFPHLRVLENVAFGLHSLSRRERRRRAVESLERVGLGAFADRHPHQLSGGQQQRVALARALAPEPRLLLLDEPFSNLDTSLKADLRQALAELLGRSGVPTLLVVHDAEDAFVLADRVHVMRAGRLLQSGPPQDLYRNPAHLHVARFFGETNLLPARPEGRGFRTPLGPVAGERCGREAFVLVRPEHVRLSRRSGGGAAGVVRRAKPHGRRIRVTVVLDDGSGGEAQRISLTALVRPEDGFATGDRVYVSAPPEEMRLLDSPEPIGGESPPEG